MKSSSSILCFGAILMFAVSLPAPAQLYVSDANGGEGFVNEYTLSGNSLKAPLVRPDNGYLLEGIAVSSHRLFTADFYTGTIGEFSAATGAVINSHLIDAPAGSYGVAVANNLIYVSNAYGTLTAYSEHQPNVIVWMVTGLGSTGDVAVQGGTVYVNHSPSGSENGGEISSYNAFTGAVKVPALVSGLYDSFGLALSGDALFVSSYAGGTIGEYSLDGKTINASLVTNVPDGANGMAVVNGTIYLADGAAVRMYSVSTGLLTGSISGFEDANGIAVAPTESATSDFRL